MPPLKAVCFTMSCNAPCNSFCPACCTLYRMSRWCSWRHHCLPNHQLLLALGHTQQSAMLTCAGLLHPSATVMDLNIGAALWMAARAEGKVTVVHGASSCTCQSCCLTPPRQQPAPQSAAHSGISQQADSAATAASVDWQPMAMPSSVCCTDATQHGETCQDQLQLSRQPSQDAVCCQQSSLCNQPPQIPAVLNETPRCAANRAQSGANSQHDASQARSEDQLSAAAPESSTGRHDACSESATTSYGWYKSAARVVLLGHGADEQHAGYGRHRTSFRNQVYIPLPPPPPCQQIFLSSEKLLL